MDVYSTSFNVSRRSRHIHSPSASLDLQPSDLNTLQKQDSLSTHRLRHASSNLSDAAAVSADTEAIQKLVMMAMAVHGCHISYFLSDNGRVWNFHVTGAYQQVMMARGLILKECPIQVRF
jgi:hypothetical protein